MKPSFVHHISLTGRLHSFDGLLDTKTLSKNVSYSNCRVYGLAFSTIVRARQSDCPACPQVFYVAAHLLFHFASWDLISEAATHVTFEDTLKQLYFNGFIEYHIEVHLLVAPTAVTERRRDLDPFAYSRPH